MKVTIIFPGQGSQYLGMLNNFYNKYDIIKNIIDYSSNILNYDVFNLTKNGPIDKLNNIEIIQPLILVVNVAIWNLFYSIYKIKPSLLVGHSLGEYSALVCSNILKLKDAINIVTKRSKLMKNNARNTNMISIIDVEKKFLKNICKIFKNKIEISLINGRKNTVISGYKNYINLLYYVLKNKNIKVINLKNNIASHCNLMFNISKEYNFFLKKKKWYKTKISILHNSNLKKSKNKEELIGSLVEHLYKPVMWNKIIKYLEYIGINKVIECGTNNILSKISIKYTKLNFSHVNKEL